MTHRQTVLLAFLVAATQPLSRAAAYEASGPGWGSAKGVMRAAKVGFEPGYWRDALTSCADRWNENPSNFYFEQLYDEPSVGFDNDESEVWWSNGFGAPAVTNIWRSWWDGTINETDVRFDNTVPYTASSDKTVLWAYGGSYRPFLTTCLHEYGHALGLNHEADVYNIMGQDWTHISANGNTAAGYPGEDASNGAMALYGPWQGYDFEDLSVSHFRYTGSSGGYSTHARTRVFDRYGNLLSQAAGFAEPTYCVGNGQTIRVEFTYENAGEVSQNTSVGLYFSTNSIISTSDTLLRSMSLFLARDTPSTRSDEVTLPSTLALNGVYWVGPVIDRLGTLSEDYENNNATYVAIRRCY